MTNRLTAARLRQTAQEAGITFAAVFALAFFGWLMGVSTLPDLAALESAARAALVAGLGAAAKAIVFFLSGTVVVGTTADPAVESDGKVAVKL